MTTYVDRTAGFATFREGRSACIRLHGALDGRMVRGVADRLRHDGDSVRLRVECSTLARVDADAARALAAALLEWTRRAPARSVEVLNLAPALESGAAWQPLRAVADSELLFLDPDRPAPWALVPSRH